MKMNDFAIEVEGRNITITNPDKILWPEAKISKLDYINYLVVMAKYILPYSTNRLLTTIRYPHGIHGKSFYQKNIPDHSPSWIPTHPWHQTTYILANDMATLVWLGNQACLELHVSFNQCLREKYPTELVFDLDPSNIEDFAQVLDVALKIGEVLHSLGLFSQPKTSGASGLQIYIPIEANYSYGETRQLTKFIAEYIAGKFPHLVTLERLVKNRGTKLYFDYLQHWEGKTLAAPYTTRARIAGSVSTPVTWQEITKGFHPTDFTLFTVQDRVNKVGDLFESITVNKREQSLGPLLHFIKVHR